MQVLTPSGYKSPAMLANDDEISAFDAVTGAPIINHVENIDSVDYAEWCRWWQLEETIPPFAWYRINGSLILFREQSVWRNGANVCHARDLVVGDEIYDDADQPISIASIEAFEDESLIFYRFDIDGDHSYIVDGVSVHNASRFWVGGTGTWDLSTTTNWAASSGGAGSQSVPGSSDTVTFDGNSGGGTATLNFGGTVTVQSITLGGYTSGTFDNSVNNNNVTLSGSGGFSLTGTATRTVKLGNATYTLSSATATWDLNNGSNLTLTASSAVITFSGAGVRSFRGGDRTYGTVNFGAAAASGLISVQGSNTFATLNITAPNLIELQAGASMTVTNAVAWAGSSTNQIGIITSSNNSTSSMALASGSTAQWCGIRGLSVTGSTLTATNSFNLGNNIGITITSPSGGGVVGYVIGS